MSFFFFNSETHEIHYTNANLKKKSSKIDEVMKEMFMKNANKHLNRLSMYCSKVLLF